MARGSIKLDSPHLPNKLNFSFNSHAPRPPNHAMLMDALVGAIRLDFWILELEVQLCISGVGGAPVPLRKTEVSILGGGEVKRVACDHRSIFWIHLYVSTVVYTCWASPKFHVIFMVMHSTHTAGLQSRKERAWSQPPPPSSKRRRGRVGAVGAVVGAGVGAVNSL